MDTRTNMILSMARQAGVTDPYAALAVSHMEGFGGGIGDNGTSFGPWQLHIGGAMPSGIANPGQWAWSRAGLMYALQHIAGVSHGLRGQQAINAIVSRFERPAAPGNEIAGALRWYQGNAGNSGGPGSLPAPTGRSAPPGGGGGSSARSAAIAQLMQFAQGGQAAGSQPTGFTQLFSALADQQAAKGDATHAPAQMPGVAAGGPVRGAGGLDAPLASMTITSGYGPRSGVVAGESFHYGVDLSAPTGTPIHAMIGGKVIFAGMYGTGGNTVIIQDATGRKWFYHHMVSLPRVRTGQTIGAGSLLGGVGMTGDATGPHLHIGLQVKGQWVDPTRYIKLAFRR